LGVFLAQKLRKCSRGLGHLNLGWPGKGKITFRERCMTSLSRIYCFCAFRPTVRRSVVRRASCVVRRCVRHTLVSSLAPEMVRVNASYLMNGWISRPSSIMTEIAFKMADRDWRPFLLKHKKSYYSWTNDRIISKFFTTGTYSKDTWHTRVFHLTNFSWSQRVNVRLGPLAASHSCELSSAWTDAYEFFISYVQMYGWISRPSSIMTEIAFKMADWRSFLLKHKVYWTNGRIISNFYHRYI
jgi:hypothetical protein